MFTPSKGVDCFCLFLITGLPEPSLTDKYKVGLRSFRFKSKEDANNARKLKYYTVKPEVADRRL